MKAFAKSAAQRLKEQKEAEEEAARRRADFMKNEKERQITVRMKAKLQFLRRRASTAILAKSERPTTPPAVDRDEGKRRERRRQSTIQSLIEGDENGERPFRRPSSAGDRASVEAADVVREMTKGHLQVSARAAIHGPRLGATNPAHTGDQAAVLGHARNDGRRNGGHEG